MKVKLNNVISEFLVPMRDKPKLFDGDIPWCRIEDIKGKYLSDTLSKQYVSEKTIKSMNLKVYPINTLLFTCSATIGVTAITKKPLCTNQTFIGLVASDEIEIEFLYYYLGLIGKDLTKAASVTTIPYLSKRFFENLEIELPSLKSQKQIAKVLSDLDAKIEVNNKINAELETMAKLIYDYWFVQFDFPFDFAQGKPDPKGKPYKSSGGKMVYNKELKREIPEEWEVKTIGDLVDCNKWNRTKETKFSSINYLDTSSLTRNVVDSVQELIVGFDKIPSRAQRIVSQNDILYSTVRPNQEHFGIIKLPMENLVASTGFAQIRSKNIKFTNDYIYQFLCQDYVAVRLQQIAEGSVSAYPSISHNDIMDLKIVLPIKGKLIEKANTIFRQYNEKIALNLKQNQKLSELRDWILPMLMNGQVTVANEELGITNAELGNDLGMVAEEAGNYKLRK